VGARAGAAARGGGRHGLELVAVAALGQGRVLEQLGGLVAQVVGHMVFDGQHGEGVVGPMVAGGEGRRIVRRGGVGAVQRVVDQLELRARTQHPGAALAGKALGLQLQRAQGQAGGALGGLGVRKAIRPAAVVLLQPGHFAQVQRAGQLGAAPARLR
jgi:hypothetical protein